MSRMVWFAPSLLVLLLLSPDATAQQEMAPAANPWEVPVAWVKSHAIAFDTPEAGHGFDDLKGLRELMGNARVVALGEGTHGTREFFQMKHRLVEFLATEMGFTVFSIEANMPEAYRLNDYVLGGEGDPKALIKGMYFWTWNTQEVLDMVQWMREFNQSGKGRIEFTGFDMQTPDVAAQIVLDFLKSADSTLWAEVERLYQDVSRLSQSGMGSSFGVCTATFPHILVQGKRIKFTGYIKTENVKDGYAGLWWRVDGPGHEQLAFDNMAERGVVGTTDWQEYSIDLDVPADAANINFGAILTGSGIAWFDAFKVEFGTQQWLPWPNYDPDFESDSGHGFLTGGMGYDVGVDALAGHHGTKSLRMSCAAKSLDLQPEQVASQCATVVARMEAGRDRYLADKPRADVEWAIQNARVVTQCAQMYANVKTRDESMARNVEWIIDQAPPGSKVVLWAHNGHVNRTPFFGQMAQGGYLSQRFKDDLVVVGFTCHEGQYTAVGDNGLNTYALQPSGPGSIEDYFHRTGMARLLLDLRPSAAGSADSGWLRRPISMRTIGARAMDEQFFPVVPAEAYDVLIHFEQTEASRGLWKE